LHTIYQPIVSPNTASLAFTVTALLIVLIGAIVFRILDFGLRRYIGESASFINGAVYVLFVLFIPYGIIGTYRLKSLQIKQGWQRLLNLFGRGAESVKNNSFGNTAKVTFWLFENLPRNTRILMKRAADFPPKRQVLRRLTRRAGKLIFMTAYQS
jgi:F0F1-type ATP synthase membrane subunit a